MLITVRFTLVIPQAQIDDNLIQLKSLLTPQTSQPCPTEMRVHLCQKFQPLFFQTLPARQRLQFLDIIFFLRNTNSFHFPYTRLVFLLVRYYLGPSTILWPVRGTWRQAYVILFMADFHKLGGTI